MSRADFFLERRGYARLYHLAAHVGAVKIWNKRFGRNTFRPIRNAFATPSMFVLGRCLRH